MWATPAIPAGTALVAEADQLVVAVREDATVAVSQDAMFGSDATAARVVARTDVGVNDLNGLVLLGTAPALAATRSKAAARS